MDIVAGERHAVGLAGITLIAWPGIEFEYLAQRHQFVRSEHTRHISRHIHMQPAVNTPIHKAATHILMTIGVGYIRLYIVYRSAIHKIGTKHSDHRTVCSIHLY